MEGGDPTEGGHVAYADFTLSGLTKQFDLTIEERTDLYPDVPEVALREPFRSQLGKTVPLALKVATEKARSEFIIAPILAELWLLAEQQVGLFSGVDFTIDPARGLEGVCDYVITRSPEQYFIKAPVLMLVEAKNEDMKQGYAQCIAEMLGAQTFNEREGVPGDRIYGVVTTGNIWKFLDLHGKTARIDARDYYIERLEKILGILLHLVSPAG